MTKYVVFDSSLLFHVDVMFKTKYLIIARILAVLTGTHYATEASFNRLKDELIQHLEQHCSRLGFAGWLNDAATQFYSSTCTKRYFLHRYALATKTTKGIKWELVDNFKDSNFCADLTSTTCIALNRGELARSMKDDRNSTLYQNTHYVRDLTAALVQVCVMLTLLPITIYLFTRSGGGIL